MTERQLKSMINKLEGIKQVINKEGGGSRRRVKMMPCHCTGSALEGGVVGFDGSAIHKRTRGRPRKTPPIHSVIDYAGSAHHKKRGRPRKIHHHVSGSAIEGGVVGFDGSGRRKRGRPRKTAGRSTGGRATAGKIPPQLRAWHAHVKKVREMHGGNLPYSEVLKIAKNTYKY